jgi:hypothetical protein
MILRDMVNLDIILECTDKTYSQEEKEALAEEKTLATKNF